MNYFIKDGYLITPKESGEIKVEKKDIFVNRGKVSYSRDNSLTYKTIDVKGKIVMPALVNPHHHIYSCLSKGAPCEIPFVNFEKTLAQLWWILDQSLDQESTILSTVLTLRDSIKAGVTTVFDHHISKNIDGILSKMGETFENYNINGVLCFESTNRNGNFDKILAENVRFANETSNSATLKGMIGMHALLTLNDKNLSDISSKTKDFPIHCHVAEGDVDEVYSKKDYGKTIIERLNNFGLLRGNSLIVHCSHLNDKEIEILSQKDIFITQAIDSNLNNALSAANIKKFNDKGIKVVAGTDGMHSSSAKAMKNSFEFVKYINQNPDVGFPEAINMFNSAYLLKKRFGFPLGINEKEGADISIFDYIPATPFNEDTFFGHFIFGIEESRCQYVIKGDQLLLDDYKLNQKLDIPYKKMLENATTISEKMFKRFEENKSKSNYKEGQKYN